jgi:hypothetical protein
MKRWLVFVAIGAALGVFGAVACGGGNDKPPLTPDSEHGEHTTVLDGPDSGSSGSSLPPPPTPGGSPATPPGK